MAPVSCAFGGLLSLASLFSAGRAQGPSVTPVQKVVNLLEGLLNEVQTEGAKEANTYDTFSCWCKSTTESKSQYILGGRDTINQLSAKIAERTAVKEEKEAELRDRQAQQEAMAAELADTESQLEKARAEYEAAAADLNKAISSLDAAIQAMEKSKPMDASLLQSISSSLALAKAMNLVSKKDQKVVGALLQTGAKVDPSDPTYAFHSQGIIDTLNSLLLEFRAEKAELDDEWEKNRTNLEKIIQDLKDRMKANKDAMDQLEQDIAGLTQAIAEARADLVNAEATLKDDQLFMQDMTARCEARAKDWDQRSQMRADEVQALSGALAILKGVEKNGLEGARALLQNSRPVVDAASRGASLVAIAKHGAAPSLFQEASVVAASARAASQLRGSQVTALAAQARRESAASFLGKEGKRLSSAALGALSMRIAEGPFDEVKVMIQKLIERLLAESTAEATKKGFCDEELGKANQDRDFRHAETKKLDVELKALNVKKDELEAEISLLTDEIAGLELAVAQATAIREIEHKENVQAIQKAKEGFEAVKEAINILKVFYAHAGRGKVVLAQFSPIDEQAGSNAGFEGAYQGKQESSKGVIGMLEVIASDFDRNARQTEEAEAKAHAEFVEFDRTARSDIAGKETKKALDQEDLETTNNTIATKMDDLKTAQELLDSALRQLVNLKPMCLDTGMSYEDRVAKREEEVAALKRALCILDTNKVEAECQ